MVEQEKIYDCILSISELQTMLNQHIEERKDDFNGAATSKTVKFKVAEKAKMVHVRLY